MFFHSTLLGRWWMKLPTIFLKLLLDRPRPHAKYTRTLYPYIPGGFIYSDPYDVPQGIMAVLSRYYTLLLLRRVYYNLYMFHTFSTSVQQLGLFALHKKMPVTTTPFSFLMDAGYKLLFTKIRSYIKVFYFRKIWHVNISYLKSCLCLVNIINSMWYEENLSVNYLLQTI